MWVFPQVVSEYLGWRPTLGPCHMARGGEDKVQRECHRETREGAAIVLDMGAPSTREGRGDGEKLLSLKVLAGIG